MALLLSLQFANGLVVSPSIFMSGSKGVLCKTQSVRMPCLDEFSISKEVKAVRVFESAADIAPEIQAEVTSVAQACIAEKGSFSLAVPGGSVVAAFGGLSPDAFDFKKCHVFFCNEKLPSFPCYKGALEQTKRLGIPEEQIYSVGEGSAAEVAERYTLLLKSHPSIDNTGAMPSFDMMVCNSQHVQVVLLRCPTTFLLCPSTP